MNIPFIDLAELHTTAVKKDIKSRIATILDTAKFAQGENVLEFEEKFAQFLGDDVRVLTVDCGTSALSLALKAHKIGPGDEVIVTAFTWLATHLAIIDAGATPVVIDCELDSFTIDTNLIEQHINCNTRAILPVHICGNPANMKAIMDIADEKGLIVIEDACQAHGARAHLGMGEYEKCGSIGHVGTFSFFPTKNLGGIGEGGAIATKDEDIYNHIKAVRHFGNDNPDRGNPGTLGYNHKFDEIRAAALIAKLECLEQWQSKRNGVASFLKETIDNCDSMFYQEEEHGDSVYHLFPIVVANPDVFQAFLEQDKGIGTTRYYNTLPHETTAIAPYCKVPEPTQNAKHLGTHAIYIPCQPYLKKYEIEYICEALNEYEANN